jgi:exodeoxyribonuclease VII large subunit
LVQQGLLQSLFDDEERRPMTVSELNAEVRSAIERQFASVWVEGEIVNFTAARSGHWYFTLHDGSSQLRAAVWKTTNYRIRFQPFDGLQVRVRGRLSIYEPRGEYQMIVESLEPVGEGALAVAYEQIKAKLEKEGLFDDSLKRALPSFPKRIGIVTSPTGAAYFDILHVLSRRARSISIVLIPTLVQGETAGEQISEAIRFANRYNDAAALSDKIDVLIVGRGGGSAEDLWAFNEEIVARHIRGSTIPVISAVGHEVDFTIADLVADLRAATPSAAAEIVARAEQEIVEHLSRRTSDLMQMMNYKLLQAQTDLQSLALSPVFTEFRARVRNLQYTLEGLTLNAENAVEAELQRQSERLNAVSGRLSPIRLAAKVADNTQRLALLQQRHSATGGEMTRMRHQLLRMSMARLDALSPLSVLKRGFSITEMADGEIVRDSKQAKKGDKLKIRLANGKLDAEVLASE